ncbi:MAG: 30S ribosomal protein S12 methylthiotransferase RimO [Muribaculaceae bacterium]|nr:30S ribosomal protein S12 methylthiotransferase RimO [Muribaculaceae bacterium]
MSRVAVISMGCSKNLVDSERLMKMMESVGLEVAFEPGEEFFNAPGPVSVVINTCGFIGDAKEESISEILAWCEARRKGRIEGLYVMGCLPVRYMEELKAEIPEVDAWKGKTDWADIVRLIAGRHPGKTPYDRVLTTPRHHAYLKIAEGCDRMCAFCAIPLITGRYQSRTIEDIVDEARRLAARGVKELNVIAQDLTSYGKDIYGRVEIARLIDTLADVEGIEWIRLHYAYPNEFPMDLLDVMARRKNVCKYLDIALQHASNKVLDAMRRHITVEETEALLAEIRRRVPGIHLRTTLMTGFPGEGEAEFEELVEFVKRQRFERMGAFAYCEEDGTYAERNYDDAVPEEVKHHRQDLIMDLQEEISAEIQAGKVGRVMRVIIDREEPDYYVGRTEFDSPDVDPEVLVRKTRRLDRGEFYDVKITDAQPFELMAEPLHEI